MRINRVIFVIGLVVIGLAMLCPTAAAFNLFGMEEEIGSENDVPVEVQADQLEFLKDENKIIGRENVVVTYKNMRMTCDYAEVHSKTKEAFAEGHVVLYRDGDTLRGEKGYYNFDKNQGSFPHGTFVNTPYFGRSEQLEQLTKDKIVAQDAIITTCDYHDKPHRAAHYDIKASKVFIYPDDKILARNVQLRVLGKPIFWLPILHIPLRDGHSPFHLQPGHSSDMGYYVLGSKRYAINKNIKGKVHVDHRTKRGWGFGNDTNYHSDIFGNGTFKMYLIDDKNAPNQKFPEPYDNKHNDTRYRFSWRHRKDWGRTIILAEFNKLSDDFVLQDFFEREYRREADPETYLNVTHNQDNFSIFVNVEKRINHFVSTIEKLPEVQFNWNNQRIADTNVFYKNETSLVNFNQKDVGFSGSTHRARDTDVVRFDTFHEVSYPKKISFLSLKPSLNWRTNYYSKKSNDADVFATVGSPEGDEHLFRNVLGGSIDLNTKLYRIWDTKSNLLGLRINQLRHILEPIFEYEFVRMRTVLPRELFQIDAIDAIDDSDVIKFGFDNRLQTKRMYGNKEHTVNIVSYNTYLTYEFESEVHTGSTFLTWDNEIELRPYDWMKAKFDLVYDMPNNEFRSADLDFEIRDKKKWHLYLQQKFLKEGSKIVTLDGAYKINDLWGLGGYVRVEFDEGDVVEEWEIRATRDLHCWLLDLGFNMRNSDIDSSNKEVFFELTLKAFPEYPLKSGNRATYSRARIGDTVSGANIADETVEQEPAYDLIRY